jgi:hypothetical protein
MTAGVLVSVLALATLAYVLAPLRTRGQRAESWGAGAELVERKNAALIAILDLESERDAGKLSEADLEDLRRGYETEALDAIAALDSAGLDERTDELESEIARVRARLKDTKR